ncbi:MAG: hypothetical protein M1503_06725 [Thaumarchaeota archaeon]|nr:hypothetical protein [Nitrososphaerota archaeon]
MDRRIYIDSLNDGRDVWYSGKKVTDLVKHPVLGRCVKNKACEYDLHHDPDLKELFTARDDDGRNICVAYKIPRTSDDLVRYRHALEIAIDKVGGGVSDRLHFGFELGSGLLIHTLSLVRGSFGSKVPKEYMRNLEGFYRHCSEQDLTLTTAFTELKGDQRIPPWNRPLYMRIIKETSKGLIVQGIRRISTGAAYAHEIWTATNPDIYRQRSVSSKEATAHASMLFLFAIPMNTPGLKIICRPSEVSLQDRKFDFPVSWYDEVDAMVVFDNVLVPWERVFSYGDANFMKAYGPGNSVLNEYSHCISMVSSMEVLVGAAYSIVEQNGLWSNQVIKQQVADLVVTLCTSKATLRMAEIEPVQKEAGLLEPSPTMMHVALNHGINSYQSMLPVVRDLVGGSTTTSQSYRDLTSPEIGGFVEHAFRGTRTGKERLAIIKLIEDLTSSLFAARKSQFLSFSLGAPHTKKLALAEHFDFKPLLDKLNKILDIDNSQDEGTQNKQDH